MTNLATPYAAVRTQLINDIAAAPWPSPEAGFVDYIQITTNTLPPQRALVTDRLKETPMLATAGYQYANPAFSRPSAYDEEWARHFKRLAQRQAFPIDRESYFYRPLDLLGICLGAHTCTGLTPDYSRWLQAILRDCAARCNAKAWCGPYMVRARQFLE